MTDHTIIHSTKTTARIGGRIGHLVMELESASVTIEMMQAEIAQVTVERDELKNEVDRLKRRLERSVATKTGESK